MAERSADTFMAQRLAAVGLSGLCVAVISGLAVSCASSPRLEARRAPLGPPVFLSGPVAVLFTNLDGFGAHALMETRLFPNQVETVSGELLGRGNKLLFVPDSGGPGGKRAGAGKDTFIWDVSESRGYVLDEPLQAYAPTTSGVQCTNIVTRPIAEHSGPEKIDGHHCEQQEVVAESNDGSAATFRVWRAADLKGFPVRIHWKTNAALPRLSFSNIRLQMPAAELFLPPDGFTQYASVESMMSELAARQQNLKHATPRSPGENERAGGRESGPYKGSR